MPPVGYKFPKCDLCGKTKNQHKPDGQASDCPGIFAEAESSPGGVGEANTSPPDAHPTARRERTPRRKGRLDAAGAKQAKETLTFAVAGVDSVAHFLAPGMWEVQDQLNPGERTMLVDATYAELEQTYPQALVWLAQAFKASVHVQLAYVMACIAIPRLERRGIVPAGSSVLILMAPLGMGAGPAYGSERGDRNGQVHPDRTPAAAVVVPDRHPDEGGQAPGAGL